MGRTILLSAHLVLHLASHTNPDWGPWAHAHIHEILLDHTHCEKKAASTALGLIFRYPHHGALMTPLSRLAREELSHFELMLDTLRNRGLEFRRLRPSPYAARLMEAVREGEPHHLLDTLLCASLIEARSCERMQHLAAALKGEDPELEELYSGLLASEARHHHTYVDLAGALELVPEAELRARLDELAQHEARVLARAPQTPRLHDGP